MARGSGGWCSVSLPPLVIRPRTPDELAEQELARAEVAASVERHIKRSEAYATRKARETPEQKADKGARDYVRWLRRQLRHAVDAARWEAVTVALEAFAWERDDAKAKADAQRERVKQRTRETYSRAAAGCVVCAAYLADDSTAALYAEAFNDPAAPVQQSTADRTPRASST